ncbi:TIGR02646 family protein [filamentous cyanobacterium LEGE 11480]|uniref:TIGR02646 family protein n=1 Tax=Romeriopsis navalis LEGE 11480 TaxID=2777977 RepID=A0A928VKT0_9CYAN|nr:retron system putative HNH endonuclease [Romeriopsis navalis]MBE9028192.1 TIGR02646 family protein [Romeriopsis navalis LEGE 11480]
MRFIQKDSEPASFTTWKQQANENWQPTWENFQKPEKTEVLAALLQEQGYICCYCGQRISAPSSHIEHLKPRKHFPAEKLAYSNFLASCPGYPETENLEPKPLQEFCGHQKSDWYNADLLVTPLDPDCAAYFRYTALGEILPTIAPTREPAAKTTIERLGLDHSKLDRGRREAIEGLGLTNLLPNLTNREIQQFIDGLNQPDASGQLPPFCAALIYQLQSYLGGSS